MNQNQAGLPFRIYYFSVFFLALAGLTDSLYLAFSHYRNYTDIGYSSFCAISRAINCDTVSQSPYAVFWGAPVAVWGVFGYLFLLFLIGFSKYSQRKRTYLWVSIFIVSFGYSFLSIILALVSTYLIRSYCIMCILTYAFNLIILYLSWIVMRRFDKRNFIERIKTDIQYVRKKRAFISSMIVLLITMLFFWVSIPKYWEFDLPEENLMLSKGITEEGYPWIGADNPKITLTEFSDYMCFQCKKMHFFLRKLVSEYPDQIRLIHRHFPMDNEYNPLVADPFHSGSGKMALIAIYAQYKEQFWEVNDLLYDIAGQKKDFSTRTISEFMGANQAELVASISNKYLRLKLKHDIAMGLDAGVSGTPTYLIDGKVYLGNIPPEVLKIIDVN